MLIKVASHSRVNKIDGFIKLFPTMLLRNFEMVGECQPNGVGEFTSGMREGRRKKKVRF